MLHYIYLEATTAIYDAENKDIKIKNKEQWC